MKLIIYSPSAGIWGGGQIYIDQLCSYLNQKGISAAIASSEPEAFSAPAMAMPKVTSRRRRLLTSGRLANEWKAQGFTHVLLNDLASVWLAPIFRAAGYNVSALLHLYLQKRSDNPLGHAWLEYHLIKLACRLCNRIFSVNKDNVAVLGQRVHFIGNFVPDWFFPRAEEHPHKRYDFIFVGRLAAQKNLPLFLRLLSNLNMHSGHDYTALLVGEGELEKAIREEVARLGLTDCVTIQPWAERLDLPQVYDQGRVFVVSSHHEGFATTLLEAHARGLPAIVTRSSGFCAEFVEEYGQATGLVFEPGDVDRVDFQQDVLQLLEQSQRYREMCIDKARQFTEDSVLGPIADYLRSGA